MPKRKKASKREEKSEQRRKAKNEPSGAASTKPNGPAWDRFVKKHSVLLLFCLACTIAGLYEAFSSRVQAVGKADLYMKPETNLVAIYNALYPSRSSAHYGQAYQSLLCSDVEFAETRTCVDVDSSPAAFRKKIEDAIAAGDRSSESMFRAHITALLRDNADAELVADAVRAWRTNHPYSDAADPRGTHQRQNHQDADRMLALKMEALRLYAACQQSNWIDSALIDRTETVLRQILRANPKDGVAFGKLGAVLVKRDRINESISCLENAIQFQPADLNSIKLLSQIYHQREQVDDALRYCKLAVEVDANDAVARINLGRILAHIGNMPEAESHLRKAIEISETVVEAHNLLALVLIEQERYREAIEASKTAVELTGGSSGDCLSTLATAYEQAGDLDNARRVRRQLDSL